jgi:phosphatidylglycerol---prolipoprotein diacylglyceryl transferase
MLPYLFTLFGFHLPTYGLLVALAFLVALALTARLARRNGLDSETVLNLGIYCAMAGIAGAKLMMILVDFGDYARNPGMLFSLATLQAAGIFYGGLIVALIVAYFYMRRKQLPLLATADVLAPGLALGHAIGRLGCFAAGCCWGARTGVPWAVTFTRPEAHDLVGVPLGVPLHPTQLYEAIAEIIIFLVLYRLISKPHKPGAIIGLYLVLYSAVRFFDDFLRDPQQPNPFGGPFNNAQWISLGLIAMVVFFWLKSRGGIGQGSVFSSAAARKTADR